MSVTFVVVSVVLLCFRPIFPFSSFQPFLFIGGFDSSALCRSRRELSNDDTGQLKCSDAGLLCAGISDAVSTQKEAKAAAPGRRQKASSGDKGAQKAKKERVAPKGK